MADELETVMLDHFTLPPIPGPLSATFFTDIPLGSAAIFSTEFGTRPFRPLPNPVPVHAVRSGSGNDIRDKSCDLFARYQTIAETIVTPPTNWQDLYYYFDATDLWTEGAGFLFHVLGYIAKVNITKINYLEDFARKWSFSNEARLANMVPHQDMLSLLQTPDDLSFFGYNKMTSNDKEILNSVIRWHCEAFQGSRIPPLALALGRPALTGTKAQRPIPVANTTGPSLVCREPQRPHPNFNHNAPVQMVVEAQRARCEMAADPYQHFGKPDQRISPRLANRSSQGRAMQWSSGGSQTRPISNQSYRNRNSSQSYGGQRGSFHGNQEQTAFKNTTRTGESHYFPQDNFLPVTNNRRMTASGGYQLESAQRKQSFSRDPVYVLSSRNSLVSVHEGAFSLERSNSTRKSPIYSAQGMRSVSSQRQDSLGRPESTKEGIIVSDDARVYQTGKFDVTSSTPRSMAGSRFNHHDRKISWPEVDIKKVCTVYVTGFPVDVSSGENLEKLFSKCGEVASVNVVDEKFCAFITFKDQDSALTAITQFDGYWMNKYKSLTVRYSKGTQRNTSSGNINSRQVMFGGSTREWTHALPVAPKHDRGFDDHNNRDIMRITPPRKSSFNLSKRPQILPPNPFQHSRNDIVVAEATVASGEVKRVSIEPFGLPSKPQYPILNSLSGEPSSVGPHHRRDYIRGPLRTPEKRSNVSEQKKGTYRKDSKDSSGRSTGKQSIGSESSRSQRKTPKKLKKNPTDRQDLTQHKSSEILDNTSEIRATFSHRKESPSAQLVNATDRETNVNDSSNRLSEVIAEPANNDCVSSSPMSTVEDSLECVKSFSQCRTDCLQMSMSATNSSARSDSITSTGLDSFTVSSQSSTACLDITGNDPSYEGVPATVSEIVNATFSSSTVASSEFKKPEVDGELVARQKKRNAKHKKKSSSQSKVTSLSITVDDMGHNGLVNLPGNRADGMSKEDVRSHVKTDSSTTTSSSASTQIMSANPEETVSPTQRVNKEKTEPRCNIPGTSTLTGGPTTRSHGSKKSLQSNTILRNDIFHNKNVAQPNPSEDLRQNSLESKGELGSRTPKSCKNKSSPKESRPRGCEESRTPTRKPLSRPRNKQPDQKHPTSNRKENKDFPPSTIEILSDPSNWPPLGSTKSQIDTRPGNVQQPASGTKPLGERTLPSVPIRRDSMASVLSQSTQIVRRLTTDSPNSPISSASSLWPVVKRWDGRN